MPTKTAKSHKCNHKDSASLLGFFFFSCKEGVLGPEKSSGGISNALKDLNFSLNSDLNTYKETATTIYIVCDRHSFGRNMGYSPP